MHAIPPFAPHPVDRVPQTLEATLRLQNTGQERRAGTGVDTGLVCGQKHINNTTEAIFKPQVGHEEGKAKKQRYYDQNTTSMMTMMYNSKPDTGRRGFPGQTLGVHMRFDASPSISERALCDVCTESLLEKKVYLNRHESSVFASSAGRALTASPSLRRVLKWHVWHIYALIVLERFSTN